jgi:hypothetical protein
MPLHLGSSGRGRIRSLLSRQGCSSCSAVPLLLVLRSSVCAI